MKEAYKRPVLKEYGRLEQLTLGATGAAPDYDQNLNVIDSAPTCQTETEEGVTRLFCVNVLGS
jgi:hypothetical protein